MKRTIKSALAILLCAAAVVGLVALPTLITEYGDSIAFSRGATRERPGGYRPDVLNEPGAHNEVARALYIDHIYVVSSGYVGQTQISGGEAELAALKEAGVAPPDCTLSANDYNVSRDSCVVYFEPVSGIVTSVWWNGEGVDANELIENYMSYLGINLAQTGAEWLGVEYKNAYSPETTLGRYSPQLELYVSLTADEQGKSAGISVSSHTADEMKPLLGG